jgi:hypothetical protein
MKDEFVSLPLDWNDRVPIILPTQTAFVMTPSICSDGDSPILKLLEEGTNAAWKTKYFTTKDGLEFFATDPNFKASCDHCKKDISELIHTECEECGENDVKFRLCMECFNGGHVDHPHDDFYDTCYKNGETHTYMMSSLSGRRM